MKICLATIGSDGDVQPYLALAQGLLARGHDVHLAAVKRYAARAEALGGICPPARTLTGAALSPSIPAGRRHGAPGGTDGKDSSGTV